MRKIYLTKNNTLLHKLGTARKSSYCTA